MSEMFSFEQFAFGGVPEKYSSYKGFESGEGGNIMKQNQLYGTEDWGGKSGAINSFGSDHSFYQGNMDEDFSKDQKEEQVQMFPNIGGLDDFCFDMVSPPFQPCQEEIKLESYQSENSDLIEPQKENPYVFPLASLGILNSYSSRFKQLTGEKINVPRYDPLCTKASDRKLSTDGIIRLAGEKFIQSCSQRVDDLLMLSHPFSSSLLEISGEETRDVELVQYLLASAEKVGQQQFERASKLLNQCEEFASKAGNPVQRLVYYFSEALREKINRETGRIKSCSLGKKQIFDLEEAVTKASPSVVAFHQEVPFAQVSQFTGMQTMVENVADAKKVHIIDLEIRNGIHCTVLMQALAARCECPIEHLKITAIEITSKPKIEEIGKRLMGFAQSMNLTFSFNVVMVADMLELNEELFELDAEEAVAVYAPYILRSMIAQPEQLDCVMRVIRNINPCVVVIAEVEANHNSPVFVTRFIETLFFYSAFFDSLEDCMDHDDPNRLFTESVCFSQAIRNTVAAEGEERIMRNVNVSVWRAFFARFGMVEIELSMSSLYQADLVAKHFACWSSCTLDMDGKSLIIGWKGTPIFSLSAWKFL